MLDLQEAVNGCTKTIIWRSPLAGKQTLEVRVCYRLPTPRLHVTPHRIPQALTGLPAAQLYAT